VGNSGKRFQARKLQIMENMSVTRRLPSSFSETEGIVDVEGDVYLNKFQTAVNAPPFPKIWEYAM
jgi:hypothetical protein